MDIIQECFPPAPVPRLSLAVATLRALCDSVQRARWSERQLHSLTTSAAQLLCSLNSELRAGRLAETQLSLEIDTFQGLIKEINSFVQNEQGRGFLKLLFAKDERIAAIENYYRRLCACAYAFQISTLVNMKDWQKRNEEAREVDRQLLDDRLTELEANHLKLREVLEVRQNNMVAMMTSLQKSVSKRQCGERERRFFSSTLNYLVEVSGQHVPEIESWMVTAFDVEFGPEIGSGGFGQVHKGVWNRTQVALKVLTLESGVIPSVSLIRRELRTWSALLHPHILQFLGANVFDDRPFIVMPFLKNGNARDYVNDHPDCNRTTILHHISLGLVYLHHNNVIHGDLKALNVLIDDAGHAVLCDFGLSRIKCDATTRSGRQRIPSVVGSRNWMSPERIMGGALRKPVDIYAFGMTMYEILSGQVPLGHIEFVDFIHLVVDLNVRPERPEDDGSFKISNGLWYLAEYCWAKAPQDRPSALAICDAISSVLASHSDTSLMTNIAAPLSATTSSTILHGAPPKYDSDPQLSSPSYSPATPLSGSPPFAQLLSNLVPSTVESQNNHDIGIDAALRNNLEAIPCSLSDASSYSGQFDASSNSSPDVTTRNLPYIETSGRRPATAGRLPLSQVTASRLDYAGPTYSGGLVRESAGSNARVDPFIVPTRPYRAPQQVYSKNRNRRAALDSSNDRPTTSGTSSDPTPPSTSDGSSVLDSMTHEGFDGTGPSSSRPFNSLSRDRAPPGMGVGFAGAKSISSKFFNPTSFSVTPNRRVEPPLIRDTPNVKVYPWHGHGKQMSESFLLIGRSGSERHNGFDRMKSWFGKRPSATPERSDSPVQDISGFRIVPPRFSLPRSKSHVSEMWSLDDLIDRWVERSPDPSRDEEFQDMFLMTYTVFTTCTRVFEGLRQRFDATANDDGPPQARAFRRHNIISAVIYWVSGPCMPVESDALVQMKEFANSVTSSSFMGDKAKEIAQAIDRKTEDYLLPAATASPTKSRALLDNSVAEIAAALAMLEGVMYSRIKPADYIAHLRQVQAPNSVADAISTTRKIMFWVKQKVLRSDQIKTRAKAFTFFVKAAEVCQEMRNFSSMAAIISALESDVIQCLSETLEEAGPEDQKLLTKLSNFVRSEPTYHMALNSSDDPCVPRLEFHLRELEAILPTCLPNVGRRAAEPINLMGCITLATSLQDLAKLKIAPMKTPPGSDALLYLIKQLNVIEVNTRTHDELRLRSRFVKAQEAGFRGSRVRGLKNSGFF